MWCLNCTHCLRTELPHAWNYFCAMKENNTELDEARAASLPSSDDEYVLRVMWQGVNETATDLGQEYRDAIIREDSSKTKKLSLENSENGLETEIYNPYLEEQDPKEEIQILIDLNKTNKLSLENRYNELDTAKCDSELIEENRREKNDVQIQEDSTNMDKTSIEHSDNELEKTNCDSEFGEDTSNLKKEGEIQIQEDSSKTNKTSIELETTDRNLDVTDGDPKNEGSSTVKDEVSKHPNTSRKDRIELKNLNELQLTLATIKASNPTRLIDEISKNTCKF